MRPAYQIWRDRRGRLSWLRLAALALLLTPVALVLEGWLTDTLEPRLLNDLVHRAGYWALLFLLVSLAITPLRQIGGLARLIDVRRMIGVGAFLYATAHILLYVAQEHFDLLKVASEIFKRLYLTIGFVAWLGLLALAATSTDAMLRRLGPLRWRRLHQASYGIGVLALIHFFQQTKADFTLPAAIAALFVWLMAYRLVAARMGSGALSTLALFVTTLVVTLLTFLVEAMGVGLWYDVPPQAVLGTAFDFDLAVRPGWYVLIAGLGVVLIDLMRSRPRRSGTGRPVEAVRPRPGAA